ncbi:hypothetical protein BpHYR1_036857 [Brachionus plicatilis]|uniref:Uncharacterized protein n=1 Tax=Brachionus plicatilis TaxID=10195 RepID=A0A3M7RNB9_BRAPC|nr:hypothetical protein BpHYR1_036857 [Brachionus plicatilis]
MARVALKKTELFLLDSTRGVKSKLPEPTSPSSSSRLSRAGVEHECSSTWSEWPGAGNCSL